MSSQGDDAAQSTRSNLETGQSRSQPDADPSEKIWDRSRNVLVPVRLLQYFSEPNAELVELCAEYPWLKELEKYDEVDLSTLRQSFFADGQLFMSALREYLNERKWAYFLFEMGMYNTPHRAVLFGLLNFIHREYPDLYARKSKGLMPGQRQSRQNSVKIPDGDGTPITRLMQAFEVTWANSAPIDLSLARVSLGETLSHLETNIEEYNKLTWTETIRSRNQKLGWKLTLHPLNISRETIEAHLSEIEQWIDQANSFSVEVMTFGFPIAGIAPEPAPFSTYPTGWHQIGRNLMALGMLVGANVWHPQLSPDDRPLPVFAALKNVINSDIMAVNIMLSRMEAQNITIRRQRQVITALQFRHLLENLPRSLQHRAIEEANNQKEKAAVTTKWNQMKEAERWLEFWGEAVTQVYSEYIERGRQIPSNKTIDGKVHKASPFVNLLKDYLPKAYEKGKGANDETSAAVRWLTQETPVGIHVRELYSTLSQLIHQFSNGDFSVDPLTFSPVDARILAALVPEKGKDEELDFKKELRRYLRSTPTTQKPASQEAKTVVQVTDSTKNIPAHAHAHKIWNSTLSATSPPGLSSQQFTNLLAKVDKAKAKIQAEYEPTGTDITPNGTLHSITLAALFDLAGQTAIAAAGQRITGHRLEVNVKSLDTVHAGQKLTITGTAERRGKKQQDVHWSTDIAINDTDGTYIAKGHFKAWGVEPLTEEE